MTSEQGITFLGVLVYVTLGIHLIGIKFSMYYMVQDLQEGLDTTAGVIFLFMLLLLLLPIIFASCIYGNYFSNKCRQTRAKLVTAHYWFLAHNIILLLALIFPAYVDWKQ